MNVAKIILAEASHLLIRGGLLVKGGRSFLRAGSLSQKCSMRIHVRSRVPPMTRELARVSACNFSRIFDRNGISPCIPRGRR